MSGPDLYFSSDCETTGQVPGIHGLISIGTVVLDIDKTLLGYFAANLKPVDGTVDDPKTMAWWATQPEAYARNTKNQVAPEVAMKEFNGFIREMGRRFPRRKIIPSAWPASFDAPWFAYYARRFAGEDLLGHSWECIKSVAAGAMGKSFAEISKGDFPKDWAQKLDLTHVAVEDAFLQGAEEINLHRNRLVLPAVAKFVRHPDMLCVDLSDIVRPLLKTGVSPAGSAGLFVPQGDGRQAQRHTL